MGSGEQTHRPKPQRQRLLWPTSAAARHRPGRSLPAALQPQPSPWVSSIDKGLFPSTRDAFFLRQQAGGGGCVCYTWAPVHKRAPARTWVPARAGARSSGNGPGKSSANSTDKIVPQIPKAGLGLSDLAPKTAPAYISRARAASLILRNHVLRSPICHSDSCRALGRGGSVAPSRARATSPRWLAPAHATARPNPKARAERGCLPPCAAAERREGAAGLSDTI